MVLLKDVSLDFQSTCWRPFGNFFVRKVFHCFQMLSKSKIVSYYIGLLCVGVYSFKIKLLHCWNKLELAAGKKPLSKWELYKDLEKFKLPTWFVFSHRAPIEFEVLFAGARYFPWIQFEGKKLDNVYTRQWITRNGQQLGLMRTLRICAYKTFELYFVTAHLKFRV